MKKESDKVTTIKITVEARKRFKVWAKSYRNYSDALCTLLDLAKAK